MANIHKVIVVGDKETGKTSLIMKYIDGMFPQNPKLDSSFKRKEVTYNNKKGHLEIWDTCKGEQQDSLSKLFFRKAECALCVFDMTRKETFENLEGWISTLKTNCDHESIPIILVGAKNDENKKQVTVDQLKNYADEKGVYYFTCATKSYGDNNYQTIFNKVTELVMNNNNDNNNDSGVDFGEAPVEKKKTTCSLF